MFYWCARPKAAICAAAAKWRFVRLAALGAKRSEWPVAAVSSRELLNCNGNGSSAANGSMVRSGDLSALRSEGEKAPPSSWTEMRNAEVTLTLLPIRFHATLLWPNWGSVKLTRRVRLSSGLQDR